jgi:polar amino acid transport system substrate-binding protein
MKSLIVIVCFLLALSNADEMRPLTINIAWDEPERSFVHKITQEMFKRAKIKVLLQQMPNKRSLINVNSGLDDGDATREFEINKYYPNLVPVPVQSFNIDIVAVTNRDIKIEKVSDLHGYNVGVINGMKIAVLMAEEAKPLSLSKVTEHETLLKMLELNRLDIALVNKASLLNHIDKLKDRGFYLVAKPLMIRPLYLQLHKKHKQYVPRLQAALESMHADGTYQRIHDDVFAKLEAELDHALVTVDRSIKTGE